MSKQPDLILILTTARDFHAAAAGTALELLGSQPIVFSQSSAVGRGSLSVAFDSEGERFRVGDQRHELSDVRSVWNRRHPRDYAFSSSVHPADRDHIESEYNSMLRGLSECLTSQFPVNPTATVIAHSNKLNQLRLASRIGLSIPKTIISNNYEDVSSFAKTIGNVCVKPIMVYSWLDGRTSYSTYTTMLPSLDAFPRESVELSPMIYQEYIGKSFETRVTIFGKNCIATRIGSQETAEGATDWRTTHEYLKHLQPITPPAGVLEQCRKLMAALHLRFGTFDFAVRPGGEWVFLEVNQAGQFLWQEEYCPEMPVLEPFARYLQAASDDFEWDPKTASKELSLASVVKEFQTRGLYENLLKEPAPRAPNEFWDEKDFLKPEKPDQVGLTDAAI